MASIKRLDKKTLQLWTATFSLSTCLIYSLFYGAKYANLSFFVQSNRGMAQQTINGNIISSTWDLAIWGIAAFVVLVLLAVNLRSKTNMVHHRYFIRLSLLLTLCALAVCVCLVALGIVSLLTLILVSVILSGYCLMLSKDFFEIGRFGFVLKVLFCGLLLVLFVEVASFVLFNVPAGLGLDITAAGLHWGTVELGFANLVYPFLSYVYLVFVLFGLAAFVFRFFPSGWLWIVDKVKAGRFVDCVNGFFEGCWNWGFGFEFLRGRLVVVLAVVVSAVVSCLFVAFTVLPWNNPTGMMVGVDSPVYYTWVNHMRAMDANAAVSFAFSNDRTLFLLLCYALSFVAPLVSVIQFAAALLLVLLSVVSVFVLRLFTNSRIVFVCGALMVPFSFQSLGLIYSGYLANMLAFILVLTYVVLFFGLLDRWSSLRFFALLGVSVLVLFSHSWTWFIFALSLVMFLLIEWRLATRNTRLWDRFKVKALLVGTTVGVGFLIDLLRKVFSPVSSSSSALSTAQSSLGLPDFGFLVSGLKQTVDFVLGGVFANEELIVLSLVGLFVLLRFQKEVSNFFVAMVFVICVSIVFASESFVFNRTLFLFPWVLLSGLGLAFIVRFVGHRFGRIWGFRDWRLWVILLVMAFVFLVLLNSSVHYLVNINIW